MRPSVGKASIRDDYRIFIEFDNGERGALDNV
uniref:Uncharacterized protein n=1 Tax=Candidatus Kentrum sp. TC TaxID=2126339 RepID=A0A450YHY0_9GAMM|nr:MAG: hypothetical protein BECKTC1821E_GA0114239_100952 [Candidatus Kentron sp. TC]VFK46905.1 MAG: hypothetical protein BECKTC1821D_GA0114238_103721 [Candidatus Kentron sp. TC]VFK55551.1 MAG: hypothetical protein BECKTC1821F_GA0114240_100722 [Candidatus Kentron sp. TC]